MNFFFIHTPLKFLIEPLWRDEAFSFLLSQKPIKEMILLTAKDFNPPLYYILLHFWTMLLGTSEIALRSLSILFYWATILVIYLFLENIFKFKPKKAGVYILLAIFNPLLLYYAFETRMYTMFAFFSALSFYAYYLKKRNLYIFATVSGLFTQYFMIFVVAAQLLYTLKAKKNQQELIASLKQKAIPIALFLPWLLFFLFQKIGQNTDFWIERVSFKELRYLPAQLYTGFEKGFGNYTFQHFFMSPLTLLSILIIFLVFIGYMNEKKVDHPLSRPLFYYLLIWSLAPAFALFVVSLVKSFYLPRYLIFSTPGLLLLLIYCFESLNTKSKLVFGLLLVLLTIHFHHWQLENRLRIYPAKNIKKVASLAQPHDLLYVTNELDFHVAEYYFDRNRVFIYSKPFTDIPSYVGKSLIPINRIKTELPSYPTRAFILMRDGSYQIQSNY